MYKLRSAPDKKAITYGCYEQAIAVRDLCRDRFKRELIVEGEIPDEFDVKIYETFKKVETALNAPDLCILGMDLANFESVDYSSLLTPIISDNQKLVDQYKSGNDKALNSLMGKFLKDNKGHDPVAIRQALVELLK